jgi:hypothetical protein
MNEVKEGAFVIILGHVNDKEALHATRIDLRLCAVVFNRFDARRGSVFQDATARALLLTRRRSKFYVCRRGLRTANHFVPRREALGLRGYCFEA